VLEPIIKLINGSQEAGIVSSSNRLFVSCSWVWVRGPLALIE